MAYVPENITVSNVARTTDFIALWNAVAAEGVANRWLRRRYGVEGPKELNQKQRVEALRILRGDLPLTEKEN